MLNVTSPVAPTDSVTVVRAEFALTSVRVPLVGVSEQIPTQIEREASTRPTAGAGDLAVPQADKISADKSTTATLAGVARIRTLFSTPQTISVIGMGMSVSSFAHAELPNENASDQAE